VVGGGQKLPLLEFVAGVKRYPLAHDVQLLSMTEQEVQFAAHGIQD